LAIAAAQAGENGSIVYYVSHK